MEMLIENNQQSTTQETADLLKISKSIELLMKMKNVFYFTEKNTRTFWPTQCYDELWAVYSNYSKELGAWVKRNDMEFNGQARGDQDRFFF